jgi:hypothetical protein
MREQSSCQKKSPRIIGKSPGDESKKQQPSAWPSGWFAFCFLLPQAGEKAAERPDEGDATRLDPIVDDITI